MGCGVAVGLGLGTVSYDGDPEATRGAWLLEMMMNLPAVPHHCGKNRSFFEKS